MILHLALWQRVVFAILGVLLIEGTPMNKLGSFLIIVIGIALIVLAILG